LCFICWNITNATISFIHHLSVTLLSVTLHCEWCRRNDNNACAHGLSHVELFTKEVELPGGISLNCHSKQVRSLRSLHWCSLVLCLRDLARHLEK
jgi:hypothetical protein